MPDTPQTYLQRRVIQQMKLAPEQYTGMVTVHSHGTRKDVEKPHYRNVWVTEMIEGVPTDFEAIEINFTDIDGNQVYLEKGSAKGKPYVQLRWDIIPPKYDSGSKYKLPGGNGTRPFFPQYLKQFYQSGMQYEHLVITEGAFKADVATCKANMPTVGLTSITHSADREHKDFVHTDIIKLLEVNRPTRVTVLWDGDCRDFGRGDFEKHNDLNRRPGNFYKTVRAIKERLRNSGYNGEIWFACPRSMDLPQNPKGIDDLILSVDAPAKVREDLESKYEGDTEYFHKLNISHDITKLSRFFLQDGVDTFYNFHRQRLKDAAFTWEGSKYRYDEKEGHCIRLLSTEMKEFMRVGDKYYRKYQKPDAYGNFDEIIEEYSKATIAEDYGKEVFQHLPKYKSFIVRPDHFNHTPVVHDCYNRYFPFAHQQEECDLQEFERNSTTFKFIRHLFGEHPLNDMPNQINIFLDYFKLLYENPTEKLPGICLVSKEKNTGKSTFLRWLRSVFGMNMVVVGNSTFHDQFNGTWTSKLLIGIDEALIEKQAILEMIKSLMTEQKVIVRRMQKEGVPEDFFGKFIFTSNNVISFIYLDKYEDRFWVRYVPSFAEEDVEFEKKLKAEIPQFLHYIASRQLHYREKKARFWFPKADYRTSAWQKIVEGSRSHTEKNLEEALEKQFAKIDTAPYLYYTKKELLDLILQNVGEREQLRNLRRVLQHLGYPDQAHSVKYTGYEYRISTENKYEWFPVEQFGRAYKFKRGSGLEIFTAAKERAESIIKEVDDFEKKAANLITTEKAPF